MSAFDGLEYELTLISRHYLAAVQHRPDQVLDRSAYLILSRLELESPLSLKETAAAFRLDVSTINRQVGAMLDAGYVERIADPDGGVARKIRATEAGLAALRGDREQSRHSVARVVAEWDEKDVEAIHALIAKFNRSIEDLEGNRWPRPAAESARESAQAT